MKRLRERVRFGSRRFGRELLDQRPPADKVFIAMTRHDHLMTTPETVLNAVRYPAVLCSR
jgi:hypothetical protein